jgi:hypothetical protein
MRSSMRSDNAGGLSSSPRGYVSCCMASRKAFANSCALGSPHVCRASSRLNPPLAKPMQRKSAATQVDVPASLAAGIPAQLARADRTRPFAAENAGACRRRSRRCPHQRSNVAAFVRWTLDCVGEGEARMGRKIHKCALVYAAVSQDGAAARSKLRRTLRGADHARNLEVAGSSFDHERLGAAYKGETGKKWTGSWGTRSFATMRHAGRRINLGARQNDGFTCDASYRAVGRSRL